MKNITYKVFLFSLFMGASVSAQSGEECAQNLSIFAENAKVKNYKAAFAPWESVRTECPDLNIAIYAYGERILKDRLKNSQESEKMIVQRIYLNSMMTGLNIFLLKKEEMM